MVGEMIVLVGVSVATSVAVGEIGVFVGLSTDELVMIDDAISFVGTSVSWSSCAKNSFSGVCNTQLVTRKYEVIRTNLTIK